MPEEQEVRGFKRIMAISLCFLFASAIACLDIMEVCRSIYGCGCGSGSPSFFSL